ncbi:MAG TPA: zinc metallopeptidase [Candidatus Eisenbacteria bacterium]|nr:zinc metallopeptidase [Candidatus Eisenbacteria bacterium]
MFYDPTFFLLIPAMIFAFWAQWKVQSTYQRFSKVQASNGRTGREIALGIMARNGVTDVAVEEVGGILSDHYDPRVKKVRLSSHNYRDSSIASIAVAAHEVGHVLQHAQGYAPLQFRTLLAPVAGFGSMLAFPLFLVGLFFNIPGISGTLMDIGIFLFTGAVLFSLVTLPVEFDASKRALAQLTSSGSVMPEEIGQAKKVLDAAALTYVAAAGMAAIQLLRLIMLRNSRD